MKRLIDYMGNDLSVEAVKKAIIDGFRADITGLLLSGRINNLNQLVKIDDEGKYFFWRRS